MILKFSTKYTLKLRDIYYILDLGINLLSLSKLGDISILFTSSKAILYYSSKNRTIAIAKKYNNLYTIEATILYPKLDKKEDILIPNKKAIYLAYLNNKPRYNDILKDKKGPIHDIYLWHQRMAHINQESLKYLLKDINIDISNETDISKCDICLRSKYHRHINKIS